MDLANTAVRWINLDSQPTKSSENAPGLGGGKAANRVFSDDLAAIYQGQKPADSGNSLPSEEPQLETVEVRLLTTDSNRVTINSGKSSGSQHAADALKPESSSSRINQTDLINEISAFNEESQTHNASESDESLTALAGSIKPRPNQYKASAEGSDITGHSVIRATVSFSSDLSGTQAEFRSTLQQPIGANTTDAGSPPDALTATQANLSMQKASGAGSFGNSPELDTASETLQAADSNPTSAVKLEPTKPGLMTNTIAVNLASTAETASTLRVTHPLNAEGQLVVTQTLGKQASETGKPIKATIATGSEQKFKLPDVNGKQVPVKLVMIEASTTLQQWQKLKQIDSDTAESSLEAPSTLLQPESRSLRTSPELQAARLVKTEQDAQALSQKFAEQLGQRLIQNVQKGHWRAELELHPRSLGRIDVQLDFVNGQLEGHFQTHNPATRELLQEGLPRLREWLQQTGTQVASLEVNNGNSGQGGEKPTPQMLAGRQNDTGTDEPVADLASQEAKSQALKEGFDLLV
jgi:flagellar hook-length control protein FliK